MPPEHLLHDGIDVRQRLAVLNAPHPGILRSYALLHPGQLVDEVRLHRYSNRLPKPCRTKCSMMTTTHLDLAKYRSGAMGMSKYLLIRKQRMTMIYLVTWANLWLKEG